MLTELKTALNRASIAAEDRAGTLVRWGGVGAGGWAWPVSGEPARGILRR